MITNAQYDSHTSATPGRARRRGIAVALAIILIGAAIILTAHFAYGMDVDLFRGIANDARTEEDPDGLEGETSSIIVTSPDAGDAFEVSALGLSESSSAAQANTAYLQGIVDEVSEAGGGTVRIPAGSFRFAAGGAYDEGHYAIEARDNVSIVGAGEDRTALLPSGTFADSGSFRHGVDMFWYDGTETKTFLVNADFADFTVDGKETRGSAEAYNASGKGFFFKLFRDCDWRNVVVKNTDGTGFGVDYPVNSTLVGCTAIACGKNANADSFGASGFGIGVGYSSEEGILIEGCESRDNTKYGYFFEHQTLYRDEPRARESQGFTVRDCVASGNLYNFGGNRAYDVSYESCVSAVSEDPKREAYTRHAYMLENHTVRVTFSNCVVEQECSDVDASDRCYDAVRWALGNGIAESGPDGGKAFRPYEYATRGEASLMLWRLSGWPGDVLIGQRVSLSSAASDVPADSIFADAVRWLRAEGLSTNLAFRASDGITYAEFTTMLWRLAGEPEVASADSDEQGGDGADEDVRAIANAGDDSPLTNVEGLPDYADAAAWAVSVGLFQPIDVNLPNAKIMRGAAVMALQAFAELMDEGAADAEGVSG